MVEGVTNIQHDGGILAEKLFQYTGYDTIDICVLRGKRLVFVSNEKVIGSIPQEIGIFIETNTIDNTVFCYKTNVISSNWMTQ